jgi:hypothetical protein
LRGYLNGSGFAVGLEENGCQPSCRLKKMADSRPDSQVHLGSIPLMAPQYGLFAIPVMFFEAFAFFFMQRLGQFGIDGCAGMVQQFIFLKARMTL